MLGQKGLDFDFMSKIILLLFSFKGFIVSDLKMRSLFYFEFKFCMVLGSVLISFFYMSLSSFPSMIY